MALHEVAGGLGFEPRLTESESVVLPLDDPPFNSFESYMDLLYDIITVSNVILRK